MLEGNRLKCGRFQRDQRREIHGDFLCLSPLLMKQVLLLETGAYFGNGSGCFFRYLTALKASCSAPLHSVKMVLPGILGLTNFLFSQSSVLPFPREVQIQINSQCAMNLYLVAGRQNTTLLAPKKYLPRLLLNQIQSPLRVSGISLLCFCLDSVLSCADISPNLTDPCSGGLLSC